jgi:Gpi16 subunit, GPI transamidase component.
MRIYLHTLTARLIPNNSTTSPPKDIKVKESVDLIKKINYRPALDRARPSHLELHLTVPPLSTVQLTYTFDKTILRYTEYPPDANRGFDVPAAIITVLPDDSSDPSAPSPDSNLQPRYSLRTTTLLCSLPTPDFSMPYNVIIFTSTAIALAFGGVFNILVRRFVAADEGPVVGIAALKRRLMLRIGGLLKKLGVKA